ncbi:T9SS type A sorting domain-containing protein [Mesonia aestuariivivens]|uniref:T9SS type A sorting domain-containing protein n=1 Tax=Mesonia aestuariivivens TaxID=2796128 RepID=A0ABS6W2S2_9FLAO|nr:T9SS type A sorting domain-containing protein [Mesonia aestuariivivens]MBW2961424.1 T9SS type A sorting domain-containing protein [Mesonia aestuariivivens]
MYENDGKIEYRYGDSNIVDPSLIFEGENGPFIFFAPSYNDSTDSFNTPAYLLSGNADAPIVTEVLPEEEDSNEAGNLTGVPSTGTVYRFTPNSTMSLDKINLNTFKIYPNPSENFIAIHTELKFLEYAIYDRLGKRIAKGELLDKIEISNLASGLYFLELSNENSKAMEKFIKK